MIASYVVIVMPDVLQVIIDIATIALIVLLTVEYRRMRRAAAQVKVQLERINEIVRKADAA